MKEIFLIEFLIFTATVSSRDFAYSDEYSRNENDYRIEYEGLENNAATGIPKFRSTSQIFTVEINNAITFPCDAEKTDPRLPMMLKHISEMNNRERTIYVGSTLVGQNSRIIKEGNSFVLEGVRKTDAGPYICIFETEPEAVELRHTLVVQYPAEVKRISPGFIIAKEGSTVTMRCNADGNPSPAITWSKTSGKLPSGLQTEEGGIIQFENVNRHVEGEYICTASNGIGESSSASIKIHVEYKPEIKSHQNMISTQNAYEAVLTCLVHGRPKPTVNWYRNHSLASSDRHIMMHDSSHNHTLTIFNMKEEDFGSYSCVAKNALGEVTKKFIIAGSPRPPVIISNPNGGENDSYTLRWKTESLTPIYSYRIKYREVNERPNETRPVWINALHTINETKTTRDTHHSHNVKMEHIFNGLAASNDYEVTVMVENKYGWSIESKMFTFNIRKEVKISQLASAGQNILLSSILLLCSLITLL